MSEAALFAVPTSGFWIALPLLVLIIKPPVSMSRLPPQVIGIDILSGCNGQRPSS
jgi:hypothetical protein